MVNKVNIFFGPFRLCVTERSLLRGDTKVALGGRAFDILLALIDCAGKIVSHNDLIRQVWPNVTVEESNLRVQLAVLRKILSDGQGGAHYIINVPGQGYSFICPVYRSTSGTVARKKPNLPRIVDRLVGRDETIAMINSQILAHRFVTILGPGGIGKTTAAIAAAHVLASSKGLGSEALHFVDLSAVNDPALVPSTVASALGWVDVGSEPLSDIQIALADRPTLLILDNCEHVIDAAASLCEYLFQQLPSLDLMATSREALRVEGEAIHYLPSLDNCLDDSPTAPQALAYPAVQLFMMRAERGGYNAELSDADAPIVARICRLLDGIPLAIELMASKVGTYGIRGAYALLECGAQWDLLGKRGAPLRQATLFSMLDYSFGLLSENEQTIFKRLSTFAGEFSLEAAQYVAGADCDACLVTNAIAGLVEKSLVTVSANVAAPYRLLNTSRSFGELRLARSGGYDIREPRAAL